MISRMHRGLTLIELLLVITILSIALGIGAPSFSKLIENGERKITLNNLLTGISFARTQAITRGTNVTLCPLSPANQCSRDWNERPITIFTDPARKRKLTDPTAILRIIETPSQGILYGRTGIRKHFGFRPTGMARESIGHLLWCPNSGNAGDAFQIRINMGGRPILARDTNGSGIAEDAYGQDLVCP
ncbi:MAG: prepilin-type N-terminal cleavage/methylation domain-containing protein [Gammaproteobacteria bacterium]|nr:prepilin-type N-terminal cleavage/methylation domain-containing protein [Gammaproteobacteria bacterium]